MAIMKKSKAKLTPLVAYASLAYDQGTGAVFTVPKQTMSNFVNPSQGAPVKLERTK